MVTTSRSAKVNTVSRCIAARSFGMPATIDLLGGTLGEQLGRHLGDRLARRALAHPDQHHAVAGDQHVAALDGRQPPGLLRVTPPHRRADEVGMELVDRLHQQGLVVAGRPEQRVERQPAVDPAGGVAGVERVGQRRHQILGDAGVLAGQRPVARLDLGGQVAGRHAADQQLGEPARLQRVQEAAGVVDEAETHFVGARSCGPAATPWPRGSPSSRSAGCAARRPRRRGRASCP